MIYVVIQETGEYSDYSQNILFASLSEEVANKKKEQFEKEHEIACELNVKLMEHYRQLQAENPYPLSPKPWEPTGNHQAYHAKYREIAERLTKANEALRIQLYSEAGLDPKKYYYTDDLSTFSVVGVESD